MRPTLEALFDSASDEDVRNAIAGEAARDRLRTELNRALAADATAAQIPDGEYADNLLMGLLAHRLKFDRQEAMAKLDVNLSMRAQRRPGGG
jgi:hypothetical protein